MLAHRRVAGLSVPNLAVASTVSRSSTTSIVADSLWGSTPMNTLAITCPAFRRRYRWTPGGHCR
jgi:hypothetical protein